MERDEEIMQNQAKQVNWTIPELVVGISLKSTKSQRLVVLHCISFCMANF